MITVSCNTCGSEFRTYNARQLRCSQCLATENALASSGPLKDGGDRTSFATGSQRDTQDGKPRPDLLPVGAQLRKAVIHMLGSIKYAERNWELGQPQSQFLTSLFRHLYAWMLGDTSEDHLAQAGWNLDCLLDQEERLLRGKLPAELFRQPWYDQRDPSESIKRLPTRVFLDGDTKAAAAKASEFRAAVEAARAIKVSNK